MPSTITYFAILTLVCFSPLAHSMPKNFDLRSLYPDCFIEPLDQVPSSFFPRLILFYFRHFQFPSREMYDFWEFLTFWKRIGRLRGWLGDCCCQHCPKCLLHFKRLFHSPFHSESRRLCAQPQEMQRVQWNGDRWKGTRLCQGQWNCLWIFLPLYFICFRGIQSFMCGWVSISYRCFWPKKQAKDNFIQRLGNPRRNPDCHNLWKSSHRRDQK